MGGGWKGGRMCEYMDDRMGEGVVERWTRGWEGDGRNAWVDGEEEVWMCRRTKKQEGGWVESGGRWVVLVGQSR